MSDSLVPQVTISMLGTEARLSFLRRKSVDFVFVCHPSYMRQGLYSDVHGVYGDNQASVQFSGAFKPCLCYDGPSMQ